MGGKKKSSSCFCSILKSCFSSGKYDDDYYYEESARGRRIFASDEDRGPWIAEPGIDKKATAFIDSFYASRVSDPDHQFAS